jgi:flagellar biosynthesis/type III secretory pathway protein FliH
MQKGMAEGLQQGLQKGMRQGLRQGLQQGRQEGIKQGSLQQAREAVIEVLRARFAPLPNSLLKKIQQIAQMAVLSQLLKKAAVVESLEAFEQQLQE